MLANLLLEDWFARSCASQYPSTAGPSFTCRMIGQTEGGPGRRRMHGEFHWMLGHGELEDSKLRTFIEKRTVEELYDVRNDPA